MSSEGIKQLNWNNPELGLVQADSFPTFYAPQTSLDLTAGISKIGGNHTELVIGYGSTFSRDGSPDSIIDLIWVVRNPVSFYQDVIQTRNGLHVGTLRNPQFHAALGRQSINYYHGEIEANGSTNRMKIGVIGHEDLKKQARGGRPDAMSRGEGSNYLYLAGRLQKPVLVPVFNETSDQEQRDIDLAINQARIDGVISTLGLLPQNFIFDQLAYQYVGLSYLADRRIERAGKAESLLNKNYGYYQEMLSPILRCFIEVGILEQVAEDTFEKKMSLTEEAVRKWVEQSANHSFLINYFKNPLTYGPFAGLMYCLAKVRRSKGWSWIPVIEN